MSDVDKPTTKPPDDLEALMHAIARLQHVIRSMGPDAAVAEIRLTPTRHGRYEVERAIKASPRYLQVARFPFDPHTLPSSVICEVMGVKVTAQE